MFTQMIYKDFIILYDFIFVFIILTRNISTDLLKYKEVIKTSKAVEKILLLLAY